MKRTKPNKQLLEVILVPCLYAPSLTRTSSQIKANTLSSLPTVKKQIGLLEKLGLFIKSKVNNGAAYCLIHSLPIEITDKFKTDAQYPRIDNILDEIVQYVIQQYTNQNET